MRRRKAKISHHVERMRSAGWILVKEAAELSGFSVPTIYRWIREAEISTIQVAEVAYVRITSLARKLGPEGARVLLNKIEERKRAQAQP